MVGEDGFVPPPIPTCVPDPYYSCGPDGDPYWANVGLLLHADGTNGQTTTVNAGIDGQTLTAVGSAVLSTTQKKWGPSSIFMPGNGSRFECAGWSGSQLGSGDFTIEFWFYLPTATANGDQWFLSVGSFGAAGTWMVSKNNTQGISFVSEASGGVAGNGSVVPLDQWYHVAICRVGTIVTLYRNGVVWNTGVVGTNFNNTGTFRVGSHPADNPGVRPAYIDDLRITKGIARYTGPFNIPAEAFPDFEQPFLSADYVPPLLRPFVRDSLGFTPTTGLVFLGQAPDKSFRARETTTSVVHVWSSKLDYLGTSTPTGVNETAFPGPIVSGNYPIGVADGQPIRIFITIHCTFQTVNIINSIQFCFRNLKKKFR